MDDHVAAYLTGIQTVIPDLEQADGLVGNDVEDEDVERVVAQLSQESFHHLLATVDPAADVIGHQEAEQGRDGE